MSVYADTSVLVSLYMADSHSSAAEALMKARPAVWVTPLHRAEWAHAVERHAFQRLLTRSQAQRVHRLFGADLETGVWRQTAMPEAAYDLCVQLARRYTARLGVRTMDTLHVACALELEAERFWTFDQRQRTLARAVGLAVR